ncbi:retrovirus-related pol polyprotein from transposon TNT 1-94, partial [Tanacetum coccineum]
MDSCGLMRIESIKGKKYILVIVDDYSRFTWSVTSESNGTEFMNQTLQAYYDNVGISHQTSVARTPQQNDVVKIWDRTLVEAARTMLIFSEASLFLWAENDGDDQGKLKLKADIGIFVGYAPAKKA